ELAVTCLSKAGGPPARQGLQTALRDPVETVRGAAAALLRDHFTAEYIPAIQRELSASPDDNVRTQLALLLGMSGDPSTVPFLRERLEKEKDRHARRAALLALARLKDQDAQQQVIAGLQQDDAGVRVKTLESLLYVNDRQLVSKLQPALGDTRQGSNIGSAHL